MAGKSYEMTFELLAQLSGNFGGSFSKAQQHIKSLQEQIVALNRKQGDISAYQKQQRAVEATKSKLEVLQQQYDNIQREIQETGQFSSTLENKLLSKQQQIDKTTASLNNQTQKLDEMGAALREAGIDTNNLTGESERLAGEIKDLQQQQEAAADSAEDFGSTASGAFETVGNALVTAGIAAGLHEIWEAYLECVTLAADFGETMSTVEALSGANADEMATLTAKAKELGATTKYTAQESAQAMTYMAMAGWDATEMLSGMDGVLALAAASGEDLAAVSDIVTDNLTAFGLGASDTAHFADVLAAAATNSNTSVSIMGETFKNSAAIAGALGFSIDDVAVAVGLMANAGVKGSNAGTALKNIFSGLLNGVTLTSSAFGELEYSAMNADGTMKSFGEIIQDLRGYFDQMTGAEKAQNAQTIAGQRAFAGFLSILNATDEDFASLTASIQNCTGAAQRMADIKMDNLSGDLTLLNSAWDALKVTIGEQFEPEMRKVVQLGTDVTTMTNDFAAAHPALTRGVMAFVAAIGAGVAAITGYMAVTKVAIPLIELFGTAMTGAIPGVGPILAVTAALAALAGVMVGMSTAANNDEASVRNLTAASQADYEQIQALKEEYAQIAAKYGEASPQAQALAAEIENLTNKFNADKTTLADYMTQCDAVNTSLTTMLNSNREAFEQIGTGEATTSGLVARLQELASESEHSAAAQAEMKAIVAELNNIMPDLALSYEDVVSGATDYAAAIEATIKAQADAERQAAAQRGATDAYKAMTTAEAQLTDLTAQRALAQERYNTAEQEYLALMKQVEDLGDTTGGAYYAALDSDTVKNYEAAKTALAEYDEQIAATQATYDLAASEHQQYVDALVEAAEETTASTDEVNGAINTAIEAARELAEAYTEAYESALSSISGQYKLWDTASEVVATSASDINEALKSQASYWSDYNRNLQSLSSRTGDISGLSDVIASFADGSSESVNAIAGMAAASDSELQAMVSNWQAVQQQQKAAASSLAELETDFTASMSAIESQVQSSVGAMNVSSEAAAAAKATVQAFADSATAMLPTVRAAFGSLASAASGALSGVSAPGLSLKSFLHFAKGTSYAPPGIALLGEQGPELVYLSGKEDFKTVRETQEILHLVENAQTPQGADLRDSEGPDFIAPGVALVGRNGPELVYLSGGEKIKTAQETQRLLSRGAETGVMELSKLFSHQFATGTNYAPPGMALVGEQGPELVYLKQQIQNERETREYLHVGSDSELYQIVGLLPQLMDMLRSVSRAQADVPTQAEVSGVGSGIYAPMIVQVTFQIEGNATSQTVDMLNSYGDEFAERVLDVLENAGIDATRRRY